MPPALLGIEVFGTLLSLPLMVLSVQALQELGQPVFAVAPLSASNPAAIARIPQRLATMGLAMVALGIVMSCLAPEASAACIVQNMNIQRAGQSNIFCSPDEGDHIDAPGCQSLPNEPGNNGCPADKFAYQCPLGRFNPQASAEDKVMGFTFQTIINLNPGSTASQCTTGQYVAGIPLLKG
ncbi:MAG: hypothetical protein J7545_06815 [Roseofilum sp. SBFL]|uniref:hypothetical protein n=1 Tax=unclassified Roseofilum TaxID=2620099 RepID=UPI001B1716C5|nr:MULTISPECIES: hypothetical protein [unclassified Roseofilum]MBP0013800.1 hypothetical protein [Roseofilum sp. SID3]MBP0025604.1 hypothetical protein [Roseofilum sp. SID2]MBP0037149.1 hypothetical protein [Roseofilum sp. SID1]MBP0041669.1 hypothetical protein [Roseofilum sp. SBFL]